MPEIGYNDGSYLTQKGNDLIAKLMASGEGLQFTRVSVGDGSIPSGSSPDSMTDLGHEVMDGMIASIANSNNGEVSIVAQVSSVGVETGFNATELGLWATDPDEGEILYTYLSLQERRRFSARRRPPPVSYRTSFPNWRRPARAGGMTGCISPAPA